MRAGRAGRGDHFLRHQGIRWAFLPQEGPRLLPGQEPSPVRGPADLAGLIFHVLLSAWLRLPPSIHRHFSSPSRSSTPLNPISWHPQAVSLLS